MDGIMPPENSPEVLAVSAYISYLSENEKIGSSPEGRGTTVLKDTGFSPNPANGKVVYKDSCQSCHSMDGSGLPTIPPVWGMKSYNDGSGMHKNEILSGWIWSNMPKGAEKTLTHQQAKDVAAYINIQVRPGDPRDSKILKLAESIYLSISDFFGK